jgi:ribosomal protein S18 acetylase RimI-like enzyme
VHYRLYRPDDFAPLYAIEEICFQPPFRFGKRYMRQLVDSSNGATWIAEVDGMMAGFAIVEFKADEDQSTAYIQTIEVAPAHRGRGIGAELLGRMEDSARAAGAPAISLHVDAQNSSAIRLYRAHEYRNEGRLEHYYAHGRAGDIYVKSLRIDAEP